MNRGNSRSAMLLLALPLVFALVTGTGPAGQAAQGSAQPDAPADLPAEVTTALPTGSRVVEAFPADLTGSGGTHWIALYTTPPEHWDAHVAIVSRAGDSWTVAKTLTTDGASAPTMEVLDIAGTPAVAFWAGVGVHGARLLIARWDGAGFVLIFDAASNTPSGFPQDLDADGIPEVIVGWSPYCESYADSPGLVAVYRWDGGAYVDATARYPDLLEETEADVRATLARADDWTSSGRACLHVALGYLAELRGEPERAAAEYRRAEQIDPDEATEWQDRLRSLLP